jgi:hypothetical protein
MMMKMRRDSFFLAVGFPALLDPQQVLKSISDEIQFFKDLMVLCFDLFNDYCLLSARALFLVDVRIFLLMG